jgi:glycerophosphoryl diester phosphodiesterase
MPYEGDYTQEDFAQQMIDEYKKAKIHHSRVWAQSFLLDDVLYWLEKERRFGQQGVFLDGRVDVAGFDTSDPGTWEPSMDELVEMGVNVIAPPTWALVQNLNGEIAPSVYAAEAKKAGLDIITWTFERSGLLKSGGGYYYQSITDITDNDGDAYKLLDVLAQDVGILGIFSDWPASVTYYANCMGL